MRYLSIDIEATGLKPDDYMIEFAAVPFCTEKGIQDILSFHTYIHCPSYEVLEYRLQDWVKQNNRELIEKAYQQGVQVEQFRNQFENYLQSTSIQDFFFGTQHEQNEKKNRGEKIGPLVIMLFGKSLNAIDLPFMNRDLSWEFMQKYFHHRVLDLSSVASSLIDFKFLPPRCESGSELMKYLNLGEVKHTALADAMNTAKMYLLLLNKIRKK
jgi:DNA polymerase III epsilon subunit-like protein